MFCGQCSFKVSSHSVITFPGADNISDLSFTISEVIKVERNTGFGKLVLYPALLSTQILQLITFSKRNKRFMDSNSVWRFRQRSDWFSAELYSQITHLLNQHCIHDVYFDVINIRRCQLEPMTSAKDVESEDSFSFYYSIQNAYDSLFTLSQCV